MLKSQIKNYWAYQEVAKNYKTSITQPNPNLVVVEIRWRDDNHVYARFEIKKEYSDILEENMNYIYLVDGDTRELINDEVDFSGSFEECVESCFYYFHTRF